MNWKKKTRKKKRKKSNNMEMTDTANSRYHQPTTMTKQCLTTGRTIRLEKIRRLLKDRHLDEPEQADETCHQR
ncbi:unnamed protein product [Absidia cylindrospora]